MTASHDSAQTVVFLHGIGVGPESWDAQVAALPEGFTGIAPRLAGLRDGEPSFSVERASTAVLALLDEQGVERAHLCGLSLGAVVATRVAIDHPDRVASVLLSSGQVHPNPVLMKLQNAIIRLLPTRLAAPEGMNKTTMLSILRSLATLDLRPELGQITAPTLVLCGAKDAPNLAAARTLAAGIQNAELQIVPGAGHEWNTRLPTEFSTRLNTFLETISS
ncbi:alpha/beta fold hydrolase [Microbacterium sp. CH-015]|uniref:alpha/beta fold hydrolase n=1 Tax=Microbacterium sp. CH-015 TaxID=3406734 RepID=UPI003C75B454